MSAPSAHHAMTDQPILYSFRRCPYAMRARLALLAADRACEIREVKLSAKPAEMIALSPKATVPVMLLPDGLVIDQSLEIMRWALDGHDWSTRCDEALIATNDGPFKHHLDRYKYPGRHDADPQEHRAAGLAMLAALDDRLAVGSWLGGEAIGLTDAALFPFIRQFAEVDRPWFDAKAPVAVRAWLEKLIGSEIFARAMVRLAPWKAGDPTILFP